MTNEHQRSAQEIADINKRVNDESDNPRLCLAEVNEWLATVSDIINQTDEVQS
jgi:hypothetical protein